MAKQLPACTVSWDFKAAYCESFECPADAFQEAVFRKSFPASSRPVAALLRLVSPGFFRDDVDYVARVGQARSWLEFRSLANQIRRDPALNHGLLRKGLHLRISGARLIGMYSEVAGRQHASLR